MTRSAVEIAFASELQDMGYDFECNSQDLPGRPDIVFRKKKIAIFYHGCFWHSHCCQKPVKSHLWRHYLSEIQQRDMANLIRLRDEGYHSMVIWDCDWNHKKNKMIHFINSRLQLVQSRP